MAQSYVPNSTRKLNKNLLDTPVDIVERGEHSDYFNIFDVKEEYGLGTHTVIIRGSDLLEKGTYIYFEISDEHDNVIPINLPPEYESYEQRLLPNRRFTFEVTNNNVDGVGKMVFIGTTKEGKKVRWVKTFSINTNKDSYELKNRGDWGLGKFYEVGDVVQYNGSSYVAILEHESLNDNIPPDPSYWKVLAQGGTAISLYIEGSNGFIFLNNSGSTDLVAKFYDDGVEVNETDLTYQWYEDGNVITGATSRTYTVTASDVDDINVYRVDVTYSGTTYSYSQAVIDVTDGENPIIPRIESDNGFVFKNGVGTITLNSLLYDGNELLSSSLIDHQWYKDGQSLAGETGSTLTIDGNDVESSSVYRVDQEYPIGSGNIYDIRETIVDVFDGEDSKLAVIESADGFTFKNKEGTILLTGSMYDGGDNITSGVGYRWFKEPDFATTLGSNRTYEVVADDVLNKEVYGVEISYGGQNYVARQDLLDIYDGVSIFIDSDGGFSFKNSTGSLNLTARIFEGGAEKNSTAEFPITYQWYRGAVDVANEITSANGGTAKTLQISASDVTNKQTYSVEVTYKGKTYSYSQSITDTTDGLVLQVSNDASVVHFNAQSVGDYSQAQTVASVLRGGSDVSSEWSFSATSSNNITYTSSTLGDGKFEVIVTDLTQGEVGYVEIQASKGTDTLTKRFVVSSVVDGSSGASGTDAVVVTLTLTDQTIEYNTNGTEPNPTSCTFDAIPSNLPVGITEYYQFLLNGVEVQNTTSSTYSYTPPSLYADMPEKMEVQVRDGSTTGEILARDQMSVVGMKAGSDAITTILSNETHAIPTDNGGDNGDYTNSGTNIEVYEGINQLTYDNNASPARSTYKVSAVGTNITEGSLSVSVDGKTVTYGEASAMDVNSNTAKIEYTITVTNSAGVTTEFKRIQTFAKSKEGAVGQDAKEISVHASSQVVQIAKNGTLTPSSIDINVLKNNITGTVSWSVSGTYNGTAPSGDSVIVTTADIVSESVTFTASVTANNITYSDSVTIIKVREGSDALNAILTNESHTIQASSNGSVGATELAEATTDYVLYRGASIITPDSISIGTISSNLGDGANSGIVMNPISGNTISIDSITNDVRNATIEIIGTINSVDVIKKFSISKSLEGAKGDLGLSLVYRGKWNTNKTYTRGTNHTDVVIYNNTYYYLPEGVSSSVGSIPDSVGSDWALFEGQFESVATSLLLAEDVTIRRTLTMGQATNESGGDTPESGGIIRSLGGLTIDNTFVPYYTLDSSGLTAVGADIRGTITADSGKILGSMFVGADELSSSVEINPNKGFDLINDSLPIIYSESPANISNSTNVAESQVDGTYKYPVILTAEYPTDPSSNFDNSRTITTSFNYSVTTDNDVERVDVIMETYDGASWNTVNVPYTNDSFRFNGIIAPDTKFRFRIDVITNNNTYAVTAEMTNIEFIQYGTKTLINSKGVFAWVAPNRIETIGSSSAGEAIIFPVTSVNNKTGNVIVTKNDVGLGNVANYSSSSSYTLDSSTTYATSKAIRDHHVLSNPHGITTTTINAVPTSRTLTINGTPYDLSTNRSWTIDDFVSKANGGTFDSSITVNGTVTATDFIISGTGISGDGVFIATGNTLEHADSGVIIKSNGLIDPAKIDGGVASSWGDVSNKPFETLGTGLSVDANNALNVTVSGGVDSVFGRTGAVTAQSGDYTASQVGAVPASGGTFTGDVVFETAFNFAKGTAVNGGVKEIRTGFNTASSGRMWMAPTTDGTSDFAKEFGFDWTTGNWYVESNLSVGGNVYGNNLNISNWDSAYTHSQITTGNPHNLSAGDVGAVPASGGTFSGAVNFGNNQITVGLAGGRILFDSDTTSRDWAYWEQDGTRIWTGLLNSDGTINFDSVSGSGIFQIDGNTVWHAGNSDSFDNAGTYGNLRAQATTKGDVGLGNVPNRSDFFYNVDNPVNNTDANTLDDNGSWINTTGNGSGNTNFPATYGIGMTVGRNGNTYGQAQIHFPTSASGDIYWRAQWNGWKAWTKIWHAGNLTSNSQLSNGAGYYKVNDSPTFNNIEANGIGVSNNGSIWKSGSTDSNETTVHFLSPDSGVWRMENNTSDGQIVIKFESTSMRRMMTGWIDVYYYSGDRSFSVYFAGYTIPGSPPRWINTSVNYVGGSSGGENARVSFCIESDNRFSIRLAEPTTQNWQYPHVVVRDIGFGYDSGGEDINNILNGISMSTTGASIVEEKYYPNMRNDKDRWVGMYQGNDRLAVTSAGIDVSGTGRFTGAVKTDDYLDILSSYGSPTNGDGNLLTIGSNSSYRWIQSWSSSPLTLNPLGNNVAIGQTTASYTLDVNGTGRFTGELIVNSDVTNTRSAYWYMYGFGSRGASSGEYGIGLTASEANRTMSFHVPNYSAYSNTGDVPQFGWYSNGSVELMTLESATGDLFVKGTGSFSGTVSVPDIQVGGNILFNVNTTGDYIGYATQQGITYYENGSATWRLSGNGNNFINGGNVGIGDTTPSYKLDVNGTGRFTSDLHTSTINASGSVNIYSGNMLSIRESGGAYQRADARDDATNYARVHWYGISDAGATSNFRHAWYDGNSYVNVTAENDGITWGGHIRTTGSYKMYANDFELSSDKRLKTEIKPLTGYEFRNLKPSSFYKNDKFGYGYIAQEVQEHFPTLVTEHEDSYLTLRQNDIISMNTAGLQRLDNEFIQYKTETDLLKEKVEKLEQQVIELGGTV